MCVNKYGLLKLFYDVELPKYNLRYNTRDLIHSFAKSTCERKYIFVIFRGKITTGNPLLLNSEELRVGISCSNKKESKRLSRRTSENFDELWN